MRGVMTKPRRRAHHHQRERARRRRTTAGRRGGRLPPHPPHREPTRRAQSSASAGTSRWSTWTDGEWHFAEHRIMPRVSDDEVVSYGDRIAQLAEDDADVARAARRRDRRRRDRRHLARAAPPLDPDRPRPAGARRGRRHARRGRPAQLARVRDDRAGGVEARRHPGAGAVGPPRLGARARARGDRRRRASAPTTSPWLQATADDDATPLPSAVSPQTNGICSSGSTGTPKVILMDKPGDLRRDGGHAVREHRGDRSRARRSSW